MSHGVTKVTDSPILSETETEKQFSNNWCKNNSLKKDYSGITLIRKYNNFSL